MQTIERRLLVRLISHQVLSQYMEFRDETNKSLAQKLGVSTSVVAHLRRGARTYCKPEIGKKIEAILNTPPGSLFLPEVIADCRHTNRNGNSAA